MRYDEIRSFGYQIHGYKSGHQLLSSSLVLSSTDQDAIDRLSDISGSIRPGETFEPYLTCYSLPTGKYYVIARTWQDIDVPRAGCVVTKSIIIDSELWSSYPNVFSLFSLLLSCTADKSTGIDGVAHDQISFPSGIDLQTEEIVEAVFLEKRLPILIFNSLNSETISARLLSVFWPNLRRRFSICTYALSPRTIQGKPFDLTFAPSSSKSKFGDWNGRKIDQGKGIARHRWTQELIESIFKTDQPSLVGLGSVNNPFYDKLTGDLDVQRNLLWKELRLKAKSEMPFLPILGLLDIVNSRSSNFTQLYEEVYPDMVHSIKFALVELSENEAWSFYTSLLARHKSKLVTREFLSIIKAATTHLTEREPNIALEFIRNYTHPTNTIPPVLFAGIGDGLSKIFLMKSFTSNDSLIEQIDGQLMIDLSSSSDDFVKSILNNDTSAKSFKDLVLRMIETSGSSKKDKAFRNIISQIREESHLDIFDALMIDCDVEEFRVSVKRVVKNGVLKYSGFCFSIFLQARRLHEIPYLCQLLFDAQPSLNGDVFLGKIISEEPSFLELILLSNITYTRKANIVEAVFTEPTDSLIKIVSYNDKIAKLLSRVELLNDITPKSRLNVLLMVDIEIDKTLSMLENFNESTLNSLRPSITNDFLKRAFVEASVSSNSRLENIFRKFQNVSVQSLYDTAIFRPVSSERVISNIYIFMRAGSKWKDKLIQNIDYISSFLSQHVKDIGKQEMSLWAKIIIDSKRDKHQQKEAAVHVVDFSFRMKKTDPTILLKVSFPIVYKTFLKGKSLKNLISSVLFPDWDKCKTLRHDLVDRYLDNKWDINGLLEVANEANILDEVFHILRETKRGKKVLAQISKEFSK